MSVKAHNTYTRVGIHRAAPTPGSATQKRRAGFKGEHKRRRKGGGLNSHWGGYIDAKTTKNDPTYPMGLSKRNRSDA